MHLPTAIKQLYPNAISLVDFTVQDDGEGPYIAEWNLSNPQPTETELQSAWEQYQLNPPPVPKSENQLLGEQIVALDIRLMMGGL